jgi:dihydroneopterin aldolase
MASPTGARAVWDPTSSYQRLAVTGISLNVRLGAYPEERGRTQRLLVDVELFRHHRGYRGGGLAECLNYDTIYRYLAESWPQRPHTDLLEELAEDLIVFCFADPRVEAVRVTLRKPEIYPGEAMPALEVFRLRADAAGSPPARASGAA